MSNFKGLETIWGANVGLISEALHCLFNLKIYLITEALKHSVMGLLNHSKALQGLKLIKKKIVYTDNLLITSLKWLIFSLF